MLDKTYLETYAKELEAQQRAAEKAVEQAKANLNAVVGARQAVAHLLTVCEENRKNGEVCSAENN